MELRKLWSEFMSYTIRGVVFITPISVTLLLLFQIYDWLNVNFFSGIDNVGFAIFLFLLLFTALPVIGYLGTSLFWKPIAAFLEKWVSRVPLVNTIYSSTKELINSFLGDKKKFDKPVLVLIDRSNKIEKLGFITQTSLENFGLEERVVVYCPISYSMAGDVFVVSKENITPLNVKSSEVMRFLISGGLTGGKGE